MVLSHFQPSFCLCHTRHHYDNGFLTATALLLVGQHHITPSKFEVVPLKPDIKVPSLHYINAPNLKIVQSCNGLLLCGTFVDRRKITGYFLCNPTTKKFKKLSFPTNSFVGFYSAVNLAFDPLRSPHYKIIWIRQVSRNPKKYELDLYSSETDSWSVSRIGFKESLPIEFGEGVFCNGKIHWRCFANKSMYFDVENECLETMPMPIPEVDGSQSVTFVGEYFGESRWILYFAETYRLSICFECQVFEMARDYSHWFLKSRLSFGDAVQAFPELNLGWVEEPSGFSGFCFIRSEKEQEPKLVVWASGKMILYDFNDGAWKKLYDPGQGLKLGFSNLEDGNATFEWFDAFPYFETFSYFENLSCF